MSAETSQMGLWPSKEASGNDLPLLPHANAAEAVLLSNLPQTLNLLAPSSWMSQTREPWERDFFESQIIWSKVFVRTSWTG